MQKKVVFVEKESKKMLKNMFFILQLKICSNSDFLMADVF